MQEVMLKVPVKMASKGNPFLLRPFRSLEYYKLLSIALESKFTTI